MWTAASFGIFCLWDAQAVSGVASHSVHASSHLVVWCSLRPAFHFFHRHNRKYARRSVSRTERENCEKSGRRLLKHRRNCTNSERTETSCKGRRRHKRRTASYRCKRSRRSWTSSNRCARVCCAVRRRLDCLLNHCTETIMSRVADGDCHCGCRRRNCSPHWSRKSTRI